MKSQISLLAATTLALTLAACGSHKEEAEGQELFTGAPAAAPAASAPAEGDEALEADSTEEAEATEDGAEDADDDAEEEEAAATPAPTPTPTQVVAAGPPPGFTICSACHSVEPGDNGIGPSLAGVFGEKAGEVPGFAFSDAMKSSGLVWNEANLDKYLENPMGVVPGTKMAFAGVKNAEQRKAVIAYIKGL